MFVVVRNYAVTGLWKEPRGGFSAEIEQNDGRNFNITFSDITGKFYKNGKNAKLPKYLCKELLNMAISKGILFMNDVEKENALYFL